MGGLGICNTIKGAATRIASEITVAKNRAYEQTNSDTRGRSTY